jgi:SAM-dependent methyltransferase
VRRLDPTMLRPEAARGRELELVAFKLDGDHVIEGVLRVPGDDLWYPILRGVPSFLTGPLRPDLRDFCSRYGLPMPRDTAASEHAADQAKTTATFSDKWRRFKNYGMEPPHEDFLFTWYLKKLGLPDRRALADFYARRERVLEIGPGSGFNTRFIARHCPGRVFALDISEAAFTTFENTRDEPNCTVVQADLMEAPFADGTFSLIIADGVLHHTPDTRSAVRALYRKVKPGGQFAFYIYRKMGAVRQFCDSYIREQFTKLSPDECYAACEPLSELGRELDRLNATITLSKPINVLGIPAGTHNIQRLIYYGFLKCFWNDAFDFETNNMVNFDWYHPYHAWQHTDKEVKGWLEELGVEQYQFNEANPNGISVVLTKPDGPVRCAS